jgi:hypothetical protein
MPSNKNTIPSCNSLVQQIDRWFELLRNCGVDVPSSAENCVDRCPVCRSGKAKKGDCTGGSIKIHSNTPIRFVSTHQGLSATVTITALTQWAKSPSSFPKKHSVEVEVVLEGKPKYRAHLDLAADNSREPLFHLQAGGVRAEKLLDERYFGILRWPMIPLDLILVTELILYTFQPEEWKSIHGNAEFLFAIRQSEERFLDPFFRLWKDPKERGHSFLAEFSASSAIDAG